jgi:Flp pilus assembly pilin Flp
MRKLLGFASNEKGGTFEGFALSAAVIAVTFVAAADVLNHATKDEFLMSSLFGNRNKELAELAHNLPKPVQGLVPRNSDVDYSVTGAIPALRQRPSLDPCTGASK